MKIRNLLVLTITMALVTISVSAQEGDGAKTFKDYRGQRITISRYGTVVNFKERNGTAIPKDHGFRLCPSANNDHCIESDGNDANTSAELTRFPKPGRTLKRRQSLVVKATVRQGDLIIKRKLSWKAGSSEIEVDETISATSATVIDSYVERIGGFMDDTPCPAPPGVRGKCPKGWPPELKLTSGKLELTKQLTISTRRPLRAKYKFDLAKGGSTTDPD